MYHDWGYGFPADDLTELTSRQKRLIGLAEAAERYIQQVQGSGTAGDWGSYSGTRKRSHRADINQRLRQMDVSNN